MTLSTIIDVALPDDIGEWAPQPFPGSKAAVALGCSCPADQPWPRGLRFALACPAHELRRVYPKAGDAAADERLPPSHCPWCDYRMDDATAIDDEKKRPKPGDLGVCFNCASPLQYDAELRVQKITETELRALMTAEQYRKFWRLRRSMLARPRDMRPIPGESTG